MDPKKHFEGRLDGGLRAHVCRWIRGISRAPRPPCPPAQSGQAPQGRYCVPAGSAIPQPRLESSGRPEEMSPWPSLKGPLPMYSTMIGKRRGRARDLRHRKAQGRQAGRSEPPPEGSRQAGVGLRPRGGPCAVLVTYVPLLVYKVRSAAQPHNTLIHQVPSVSTRKSFVKVGSSEMSPNSF